MNLGHCSVLILYSEEVQAEIVTSDLGRGYQSILLFSLIFSVNIYAMVRDNG